MKSLLTKKDLNKLETQLSKPSGEKGIEVGNKMYSSNLSMIKTTINLLKFNDSDKVLEIGHGNGKHLPFILTKAHNLFYTGIEVSKLMKKEAEEFSISISAEEQSEFICYKGVEIPFKDGFFNQVLSVNTIYFWKKPLDFLNEVSRVLKDSGKFVITFAEKKFMETLPFVKGKFKLYDNDNFKTLVHASNLEIENFISKKDIVESKSGEIVIRKYNSYVLKKDIK